MNVSKTAWHIAVLIPARDEEELLPRCLGSVQAARQRLPAGISSDVVVVSDGSRDRTVRVAQRVLRGSGVVKKAEAGIVGCARALAAQAAIARSRQPAAQCWLANTDADCEVLETWLVDQLALAERGFAAVAGTVEVDSFAEHDPLVEEMFRLTYRIGEDGTHGHVHGANLGVRADAYLHAGGWAALATAEDHDLWGRLRALGWPTVSEAGLRVVTSGRRVGRAPHGFAAALAAHNPVAL